MALNDNDRTRKRIELVLEGASVESQLEYTLTKAVLETLRATGQRPLAVVLTVVNASVVSNCSVSNDEDWNPHTSNKINRLFTDMINIACKETMDAILNMIRKTMDDNEA